MKLLTLQANDRFHPAILLGHDVLDLMAARDLIPLAHCVPDKMTSLLAGGAEGLAVIANVVELAGASNMSERLRASGALSAFATATLGPVVPDPDLVLSGSMNSRGHLQEMGDGLPEHPCAFVKVRSALSASGVPIVPPPGFGDMVNWEGESCVVIGRRCHQVSVADARDYVVGYTLLNDISARQYVMPLSPRRAPSRPPRLGNATYSARTIRRLRQSVR